MRQPTLDEAVLNEVTSNEYPDCADHLGAPASLLQTISYNTDNVTALERSFGIQLGHRSQNYTGVSFNNLCAVNLQRQIKISAWSSKWKQSDGCLNCINN